jgi:catechol O-methyltransferase
LCEELGLVGVGSVLAADNVVKPGNPPYLEYVRSSVAEKKKKAEEAGQNESGSNGAAPDERFAERAAKQYKNRIAEEKVGVSKGRPELVYESRLVESFEPTGEPVSIDRSMVMIILAAKEVTGMACANLRLGWRRDHQVRG